jgi:hypothetical protein
MLVSSLKRYNLKSEILKKVLKRFKLGVVIGGQLCS